MQSTSEDHYKAFITYAQPTQTIAQRLVISAVENFSGRFNLIKRLRRYENEGKTSADPDIWHTLVNCYGLQLQLLNSSLSNIPKTGPLLLVANHPFGVLDSTIMGYIFSQTRLDYRIIAHQVFLKAPSLRPFLLPIYFDNTKQALMANVQTRKEALRLLTEGAAIGIFPGGTVSTSAKSFSKPMDPRWRAFTARLILKSQATVVPVYFEGQNSRLFQLASRLHSTVRVGLLLREFEKRSDTSVRVVIGKPIAPSDIQLYANDVPKLMDFLRSRTYSLSPTPLVSYEYGYDFD
jgi:putative hemolysin